MRYSDWYNMTKEERQEFYNKQYEWLKSLKKGDVVALDLSCKNFYDKFPKYIFTKVKNITAKGNVRLENGDLIKADTAKTHLLNINPVENYMLEHNKQMEKIRKIYYNMGKIDFLEVEKEDIETLYNIMNKYLKKGE